MDDGRACDGGQERLRNGDRQLAVAQEGGAEPRPVEIVTGQAACATGAKASAAKTTAGARVRTAANSLALAEVLVRLHVEPHREERELGAEDQEQRDEHDRRGGDVVALDP